MPSSPATAVRAWGSTFLVEADDTALLSRLSPRFPPRSRPAGCAARPAFVCRVTRTASASYAVMLIGTTPTVVDTEAEALDLFEGLVLCEVARRAARWVFVHAGVVGWQDRAIVIPGKSFSGKSTLVEALVKAGATYYSDECAVFDRAGRVYPFARPLMRREPSGIRERCAASDLGAVGVRALPVSLIVSTRFVPGATNALTTASPGRGMLALMANAVRAQAEPTRVMRVLARASESAFTLEGDRDEAADLVPALLHSVTTGPAGVLRNIA